MQFPNDWQRQAENHDDINHADGARCSIILVFVDAMPVGDFSVPKILDWRTLED